MRLFSFLSALALLVGAAASAQTIPARGEAATFDVASWNIENFGTGSGGAVQRDNAIEVIRQADIDLWALQEIVDVADFNLMVEALRPDGYEGILGPAPRLGGDQRLAYIYKPDVVTVVATRTILNGSEFDFAYRYPFEMFASVTVGGATQSMQIVNLHAKCCGDGESYQRRQRAATALKAYTDQLAQDNRAVLVLGDFNDGLNQSIAGGLSPYRPYRQDTDTYTIATRALDDDGTPTYCASSTCASGSTLDHLLFTQDLAASYVADADARYDELVASIDRYTSTTSDHLPVLARFTLVPVAGEPAPPASGVELLAAAPNPFRDAVTVRFRLAEPGPARIDVFDALGRRVADAAASFGSGEHAVRLDGAPLGPGLYVVRLTASGVTATQTLVRAR